MTAFGQSQRQSNAEAMSTGGPCLIKLGGSLLELPDLRARLRSLLATMIPEVPAIIVGGGRSADLVRSWQVLHGLSESAAHWLAIRAMSLNAQLVCSLDSCFRRVDDSETWSAAVSRREVPVLDVVRLLRAAEATTAIDERLPESWDVTSDSITIWIARQWRIPRVVLVKSTSIPSELLNSGTPIRTESNTEESSVDQPCVAPDGRRLTGFRRSLAENLNKAGLVDAYFPVIAPEIPFLDWCDLNQAHPERISLW